MLLQLGLVLLFQILLTLRFYLGLVNAVYILLIFCASQITSFVVPQYQLDVLVRALANRKWRHLLLLLLRDGLRVRRRV